MPAFYLAFFGAALATSAPELIVVITSAARGARELALGDALGASFVDSTLSLGIGALIVPAAVTASLVMPGIALATIATLVATLMIGLRRRLDWGTAVVLLATYGASYVITVQVA